MQDDCGGYAVFAHVVEGMDVVRKIEVLVVLITFIKYKTH